MAKLQIKPEDHLKGKLVEPGVYLAQVKDVVEKPAKGDGSQNWNVEFKIIQEGSAFKGVPVYTCFSEKAPGFAIPFIEACGKKIDPKVEFDLDFQKTIGVTLKIVIKNELYQNKMTTKVDGYMSK